MEDIKLYLRSIKNRNNGSYLNNNTKDLIEEIEPIAIKAYANYDQEYNIESFRKVLKDIHYYCCLEDNKNKEIRFLSFLVFLVLFCEKMEIKEEVIFFLAEEFYNENNKKNLR